MTRIYQSSDLSTKRRELLDAARSGYAQIRDRDGMGLVLVPQEDYEALQGFSSLLSKLITLDAAFERPAKDRRPVELGDFAWLAAFDDDDQREFRRELLGAMAQASATRSTDPVEQCLHDWRATAAALANEKGRRILTSPGDPADAFKEVHRPG
jgi:hypothetical protein